VDEVLERGDVQFVFRPTVQAADAREVPLGVQSLFLILSPAGGPHRRVRIGKNRMPAKGNERFWAKVERVGSLQRVLGDLMEGETYETKTRGERYQPAARPVAIGEYEIVKRDDHVTFVYRVEPLPFTEAPEELHVNAEGRHLILFEAKDGGRAVWTPRPDLSQLEQEGGEIVFVGSSAAVVQEA
jgi:hypothetical protein